MRRPVLLGLMAGVVLIAGAILFGPGAIKAAGAEPATCGSCHVMESKVHSFQNSDSIHKSEISCSDCHLPTGMEGLVEKYKTGFRHIMTNMKGEAPAELRLRPSDREWVVANCVRCHKEEEHIKEVGKTACLTCHSTNPHGDRGVQK
ncbi:MAG TPA: cytochrome c3 family protein [Symbiobacteriaceae bacterium]|nr:cytochrome c3 family protein [Symbiobacteriaceae bacterium]